MAGNLQPLDQKFQIVDSQGRPTEYFTRWAQQRQIDISGGLTLDGLEEYLAGRQIIAGLALDGGGPLSSDVTINHAESLVTPGTYGDATHVPQFVVDQEGHIQGVVSVAISGGGGSGAAMGRKLLGTMPALAGFTQQNITGTRTAVEVAGKAISIIESTPVGTPKIAGITKAMPGTGTNRVVFFVQTNAPTFNYLGWAFGFSDGTKFHTVSNPASGSIEEMTWNNSGSRASTGALGTRRPEFFQSTGHWYAVRDGGAGKVYFETSEDGVYFSTFLVVTKAGGFLGAGGYTNAFVGLYSEASTASGTDYPHSVTIISYDDSGAARTFDA